MNDVRIAEQLRTIAAERGKEPDCAIAAGIILMTHEEKAAEAWRYAQEEWRQLKSRDCFWQ